MALFRPLLALPLLALLAAIPASAATTASATYVVNLGGNIIANARFRFEENGKSVVYASDVGYPTKGAPPELVSFYEGTDLLIHDCTYTPEEQAERRWRGYSSVDDAVNAAAAAHVRRLALFHYDQDYSDDQVDALAERARRLLADRGLSQQIEVIAAAEGMTLSL